MATKKPFKSKVTEYPVDKQGQLAYAVWDGNPNYTMVPNEPFEAYMTFEGRHTGSYSKKLNLRCGKGLLWSMRDIYFADLLKHSVYGVCHGKWVVDTFNGHYYVRLLEPITN